MRTSGKAFSRNLRKAFSRRGIRVILKSRLTPAFPSGNEALDLRRAKNVSIGVKANCPMTRPCHFTMKCHLTFNHMRYLKKLFRKERTIAERLRLNIRMDIVQVRESRKKNHLDLQFFRLGKQSGKPFATIPMLDSLKVKSLIDDGERWLQEIVRNSTL